VSLRDVTVAAFALRISHNQKLDETAVALDLKLEKYRKRLNGTEHG
jgi:hypothetical protein